jgi:cytochrome d ubiquinol oxidase subunit I
MKVEEAATTNTGVWITFLAIACLYTAGAVVLVLVLRAMSRRFREAEHVTDEEGPYGPSALTDDRDGDGIDRKPVG